MPRYSWEPAASGSELGAPLLSAAQPADGGEARTEISECPSNEIEWPQYEILEARGCCSFFVKFHRYIWFLWFDPLMKLGAETHLEFSHIWKLAPRDECETVYRDFAPLWQQELARAAEAGEAPSFLRACANYCKFYWAVAFALRFFAEMTNFIRPLCMQQVLLTLQLLRTPEVDRTEAQQDELWFAPQHVWMLAFAMFASAMTWTFCNVHYNQWVMTHAQRLRSAVICSLYEKTMRLSPGAKAAYTSGKISNLMSNDADKMQMFMNQSPWLVMIPINIFTALFLIVRLLGVAGLFGAATMIVLMPVTTAIVQALGRWRKKVMRYSDSRMKYTLEVMSGVRIVKLMGWEAPFADKIGRIRDQEIGVYKKMAILQVRTAISSALLRMSITCLFRLERLLLQSLNFTLSTMATVLICFVTLLAYALIPGNPELTPSTAFTALQFLRVLQQPLQQFPNIVNAVVIEGRTALTRMGAFLQEDDIQPYIKRDGLQGSSLAVRTRGARFAWSAPVKPVYGQQFTSGPKPKPFLLIVGLVTLPIWLPFWLLRALWRYTCGSKSDVEVREGGDIQRSEGPPRVVLKDINLDVEKSSLCIVVGAVGAGKTSLVHALLGEMEHQAGDVELSGSVAYTAQTAFIMNDTVKNNILFGCEYDESRYNEVIYVCSLQSDLEQLPAGDGTQIGERGITLSGGQKQRLGLARACYANKDIVFLDDPLSAVDAHVGAHIFKHCISDFLKDKTVIMSCHQLQYAATADQILLLDGETIRECWNGSYSDLLAADLHLSQLMREYGASAVELQPEPEPEPGLGSHAKAEPEPEPQLQQKYNVGADGPPENSKPSDGKTMTTEERQTGKVKLEVYKSYAIVFGACAFGLVFVWFCLGQLSQVLTDWWMGRWSSSAEDKSVNDRWVLGFSRPCDNGEDASADCWTKHQLLYYYIVVWAGLSLVQAVFAPIKALTVRWNGLRASKKMHETMLDRLLHAPTSLFDVTPVGRIVNRFAADIDTADNQLAGVFTATMQPLFQLLSIVWLVEMAVPWFLLFYVPVMHFYVKFARIYRQSGREIKRLNSNSKSPIFQHFSASLDGLTSIRAFGVSDRFLEMNRGHIDLNATTLKVADTAIRWFAMRLQLCSALIVLTTTLFITLGSGRLDPATAGLALSYSLTSTLVLQAVIQSVTQLEVSMNSVERINFYCEVEQERLPHVPTGRNHVEPGGPGWPQRGKIEFLNATARYRPGLPLVLDDMTVTIEAGSAVGFCGRTGSGKSSTMLTLFRVLELEAGRILIDGVDVASMPLDVLRKAIAMLPQDPLMFSGPVRDNLDPFDEHTDSALWNALERAQIAPAIRSLPDGLDAEVGEGGDLFSVGERQLLCFARALLKHSKILVMDECTVRSRASYSVKCGPLIHNLYIVWCCRLLSMWKPTNAFKRWCGKNFSTVQCSRLLIALVLSSTTMRSSCLKRASW